MGWEYAEGDDFHSAANKAKMAAGHPLTDEDRWPWLRSIAAWIDAHAAEGRSSVVTCSALRRIYRDLLRDNRPGVRFCELEAPEELIADRLAKRTGALHAGLAARQPAGHARAVRSRTSPGSSCRSPTRRTEIVVDALAQLGLTAKEPTG